MTPLPDAFAAVRFLGFDVFGTVVDWRSGLVRAAEPFLRRHGRGIDSLVFADEWRARCQPSMERVRSGERGYNALEVLNWDNLMRMLSDHRIEIDAIPASELTELARAWERLDPWPDAVEGLTLLSSRFAIAALSDGSIQGMRRLAAFGGLPWDALTGADVARTFKPMPQVYLKSVEAAGFRPGQAAMVAAHNADLEAAASLGMRTIFVRRPHEHGVDQTSDLEPTCDWDLVAENLVEAAYALGCR